MSAGLYAEWTQTRSRLWLPPAAMPRPRPIAVDLFAGAGGFSCGFIQAGWHVAAAVESDKAAVSTYLVNLGGPSTVVWRGPEVDETLTTGQVAPDPTAWTPRRCAEVLTRDGHSIAGTGYLADKPDQLPCEHLFHGDIRHLDGQMILDALGLEPGQIGCVIGGPPCQGFSIAGKRDVMDPRSSLVFDFARLVVELQPRAFLMENVPNILHMHTAEGLPVIDALTLYLAEGGMGTYDALRKTLLTTSGNAAAIKSTPKPKRQSKPGSTARSTSQEEALF